MAKNYSLDSFLTKTGQKTYKTLELNLVNVLLFHLKRLAHYLSNGKVRSIKYTKSQSEHQINNLNDITKVVPRKGKNGQLIVVKIEIFSLLE